MRRGLRAPPFSQVGSTLAKAWRKPGADPTHFARGREVARTLPGWGLGPLLDLTGDGSSLVLDPTRGCLLSDPPGLVPPLEGVAWGRSSPIGTTSCRTTLWRW